MGKPHNIEQLARRFAAEYTLITRTERLRTVARDLVRHFVGRGFAGKAMYVAIDKATAVRMYDMVSAEWATHLGELGDDVLGEIEAIKTTQSLTLEDAPAGAPERRPASA